MTVSQDDRSPAPGVDPQSPTGAGGSAAAAPDPANGPFTVDGYDPARPIDPDAPFNIASLLSLAAARHPGRAAVISRIGTDCLGRSRLEFQELDRDSDAFARALAKGPLDPGDRVVVMVPPGPDFFVMIFGLFKAGLVPVMVDPGMGLKRMLLCLSEGRPRGMVGVALAHLASLLLPRFFKSIKFRVTLGRCLGLGHMSLRAALDAEAGPFQGPPVRAGDTAAILFTSGATGPAKGVVYTHAMFLAQVALIRRCFDLPEGGVDLATFPLFSLFSAALGLTAVIPNMNPVKPGKADPRKIFAAAEEERATSVFASPALLGVLADHARQTGHKLGSVARVISAGAPVQPHLLASFAEAVPAARLLTPYGATEAMPLTAIEASEIAQVRGMTEQGFGMCVGRPVPGHQMAVIPISDAPLDSFKASQALPVGEIGEIVAEGPVVAAGYFERPAETRLSLVTGPDGRTWRRLGDLGWQDAQGRLWFCGRKSQRVVTGQGTFFTICCEAVFNNHPKVRRSALVGVGQGADRSPVVVVEPVARLSRKAWTDMIEELETLARSNPRTKSIATFLEHKRFPVDIRHNAKISRERLSAWAAKTLRREGGALPM
jgi:acyl-CoA synthetase (AMP-forming)/AMP-acid ligase II